VLHVLKYAEHDEENDWSSEGKPRMHIYPELRVLRRWADSRPKFFCRCGGCRADRKYFRETQARHAENRRAA
jgi:hypothetical protein